MQITKMEWYYPETQSAFGQAALGGPPDWSLKSDEQEAATGTRFPGGDLGLSRGGQSRGSWVHR